LELNIAGRVVLANGQPVFSGTGQKLGAILSLHDITERQRTEERYRKVLAAMSEGVTVQNENGEIIACNASACRILGMTEEQLTSRGSKDPEWRAIRQDGSPFPGEDHPSMEVLKTRRSVKNVRMGLPRPDGCLTWLSINAEPLENPFGVVVTFVDITDNKRAEDALRDREAELREAQRLAGVGSWAWEPATDDLHWSEELYRIFGVDPSLPVPPREQRRAMFTAESYARGEDALRELLRSGTPYEVVLELVPATGQPCRVVARGEAVYDDQGNLRRVRGTVGRLE
jgi:PAS domain S-box-containing protein